MKRMAQKHWMIAMLVSAGVGAFTTSGGADNFNWVGPQAGGVWSNNANWNQQTLIPNSPPDVVNLLPTYAQGSFSPAVDGSFILGQIHAQAQVILTSTSGGSFTLNNGVNRAKLTSTKVNDAANTDNLVGVLR